MNSLYRILLATLVMSLTACGFTSLKKEKVGTFDKFPVEKELKETNYFEIKGIIPDGLILYHNSLLLIRNTTNTSKYHFSIFDLKKKSFLSDVLESGRKPGQSIGFLSYGIFDNYLWADDIIKDKVLVSNLDSAIAGKTVPAKEIAIPKFYYWIQLLNDKTMIGSGDYDSESKLALVNLSTGKTEGQIGPYSTDTLTHYSRPQKEAYESFLFLKPSHEKCILAGRYTDRVQVFDLNNRSFKIIAGPENFTPEVSVMKEHDGTEVIARNSKTRYAFVKGKVTDRFIYLLYSGNIHNTQHKYYGKYIYVYDWNGSPVQRITLSGYTLDFAVTDDDSTIYTYDPASKYIRIANLKRS